MEKLREWFGSPAAAGKTLTWMLWVSFLGSVVLAVVLGVVLVLAAALTS